MSDDQLVRPEPWTTPTPAQTPRLRTAVMRHQGVRLADLVDLFDTGYARIIAAGVTPTGPAFALYRGDPTASFDLELGFPADRVPADDTVEESSIPGGPSFVLTHVGGYDGLGPAWERVLGAVADAGRTLDTMLEVYVSQPGPDVDPATLRTDLHALLTG